MTRKTTSNEVRRRPQRVDAQRNVGALLDGAKAAFAALGVDAPARDIAERAGVGVGTMYRHFPRRSDLVVAVLEHEIDACADAGPALSAAHDPGEALTLWLRRYTDFVATKHGLAAALHSGDPAFDALPAYFWERLGPVLDALLEAATATGEIRADVSAKDLLSAVALLCHPVPGEGPDYSQRMVALLIDGLQRHSG
jgi:AcrR family transcriptional regulator